MSGEKWTENEIEFLKENYSKLGRQECAAALGRTVFSVGRKANTLSLGKRDSYTKDEVEFLKQNYATMSTTDIAKHLNRTLQSVQNKARALRLSKGLHVWTQDEIDLVGELYKTKSCTEIAKIVPHSAYSVRDIVKKNRFQKEGYWWTDENVQYLKDNFETMSYAEIGEHLGLSATAVRAKLGDLHLVKKLEWSKSEVDYLQNHYRFQTCAEIAKYLNRSPAAVGIKAKKLGIKPSPYHCDEDFFSSIDSPTKAYWLGMMYADGYVSINHQTQVGVVGLELQTGDRYHVEKFNSVINGNYKIVNRWRVCTLSKSQKKHEISCLRIYSRKMVDDLLKLDFVENKTYRPEFPKISDELFIHFLRGYFDGNGTIIANDKGIRMTICSNNNHFLNYLQTKILNIYGIKSYIYKVPSCYILGVYKKKDCLHLYDEMYKNSTVHLARKYKKYKDYIATH